MTHRCRLFLCLILSSALLLSLVGCSDEGRSQYRQGEAAFNAGKYTEAVDLRRLNDLVNGDTADKIEKAVKDEVKPETPAQPKGNNGWGKFWKSLTTDNVFKDNDA